MHGHVLKLQTLQEIIGDIRREGFDGLVRIFCNVFDALCDAIVIHAHSIVLRRIARIQAQPYADEDPLLSRAFVVLYADARPDGELLEREMVHVKRIRE